MLKVLKLRRFTSTNFVKRYEDVIPYYYMNYRFGKESMKIEEAVPPTVVYIREKNDEKFMKIAADKEYFLFGPKIVKTLEKMLRIFLVIF